MKTSNKIEAYILAGGKSSRMGQDKGLVHILGKPMISHTIQMLTSLDIKLKIISHNAEYNRFGFNIINDLIPGLGPIGGLYTALKKTSAKYILLMSCDSPFITGEVIQNLVLNLDKDSIVVPKYKQRIYPLCAIYPSYILPMVENSIYANQLKMQKLILNNKHSIINMDNKISENSNIFTNINNKEDLKNHSEYEYK